MYGLNWQVSCYGQTSLRGAVLGRIPPPRSTCTSTTFAQFNEGLRLRLGTRFGASTGAPTCAPGEARPARPAASCRSRRAGPASCAAGRRPAAPESSVDPWPPDPTRTESEAGAPTSLVDTLECLPRCSDLAAAMEAGSFPPGRRADQHHRPDVRATAGGLHWLQVHCAPIRLARSCLLWFTEALRVGSVGSWP